ncbi:MAG: hypothetical protein ACK57D_04290 [Sphingobacteriales bacterium]
MNTFLMKKPVFGIGIFFLVNLLPSLAIAQATYHNKGIARMVIYGTSNINEWKMSSGKGVCSGTFIIDESGSLTGLSGISFSMQVSTLKSVHGSQMDNNAYKAMAVDRNPNISFSSSTVTVVADGNGVYTITAHGRMQISSGSQQVVIVAKGKVQADRSIQIEGTYNILTTDYNVAPISIMMGAVKTSPNVRIEYSLVMRPQ